MKKLGFLGLIEVISDCCYVEDNYDDVFKLEVKCVLDVYSYCLVKYIGVYMVILGDFYLDVIVFIGGIGENFVYVCELILNYLKLFGVKLDNECNFVVCFGKEGVIIIDDFVFKVMVILINEELVIV